MIRLGSEMGNTVSVKDNSLCVVSTLFVLHFTKRKSHYQEIYCCVRTQRAWFLSSQVRKVT